MKKKRLFNRRGCLDLWALKAYAKGELPKEELNLANLHVTECELCSDAAEGILIAGVNQFMIGKIKSGLALAEKRGIIKPRRKNRKWVISLAASVALLFGLYFLLSKAENKGSEGYVEVMEIENNRVLSSPPLPGSNMYQTFSQAEFTGKDSREATKRLSATLPKDREPEYLMEVFTLTDEMPEFPGGIVALNNYIQKNIRKAEEKQNVSTCGIVYIEFVVDEAGKVAQSKVVNGHNQKLDQVALELIENLPDWKPGRQSGQLVKVSFTLPIRFENC